MKTYHPEIFMDRTTIAPQNIADLIDKLESYLEEMRRTKDKTEIPKQLSGYIWHYFCDVNPDKETLKTLALYMVDHIYRYISYARVIDDFTRSYFAGVFTVLWDTIQSRGVDVFYILDNELRQDRFILTVQLFALSGFAVVTPYVVKGKYHEYLTLEEQAQWALTFADKDFDPKTQTVTIDSGGDIVRYVDTANLLEKYMKHLRNIIYIEKDASVNFLEEIKKIAKNSKYLSLFRNNAPSMSHISVLGGLKEETLKKLQG